jgi:PBP1b-binding outer membrane lipoprotein LpoB
MLTRIVVIMLVGLALVLSGCEKKTKPAAAPQRTKQVKPADANALQK